MKYFLILGWLLISPLLNAQIEKPVHWKFTKEEVSANVYNLVLTASIDEPYHLYATDVPEGGPIATSFTFKDSKDYSKTGKLESLSRKIVKFDSNFNMNIGYHSGKAIFKQKIEIHSAKPFKINGTVEFMSCNDRNCLPPEELEFSFDLPGKKESATTAAEGTEKTDTTQNKAVVKTVSNDQTAKTTTKISPISITKDKQENSLWALFFTSLLAGFAGLLTPCVYPMIPMTVSFFMRGQENRGRSLFNALVFGISIIVIYTSLGGIVSLTGAGSDIFSVLSTHWIPNLIFFGLFLVFAISFLGAFELVLPSSLTNKMDQQADKGGILAPFFMALTLVLVSFSCTGPIVSAMLIEASHGAVIRPTVGMFAYSLAFALPFTLFAIFPGMMKNLPKSGGWLNAVKIFFAFILLAWSLKFISNIDQSYHLSIFTREVFIGIWMVLLSLLGFYLLGKIKFAHDSELKHVGVFRLFIIITVFSFVLYLLPGLFGAPLTLISGWLPPRTTQSFDLTQTNSGKPNSASTLCGTPKYSDFLDFPYGVEGYFDYEEGLACARKQNKPILIDFNGHTCTNCKLMENKVWPDPRILEMLKTKFVIVSLYIDDKLELPASEQYTTQDGTHITTLGKKNLNFQITRFNSNSQPFYVIMDHEDHVLGGPQGLNLDRDAYLKFLQDGVNQFEDKK